MVLELASIPPTPALILVQSGLLLGLVREGSLFGTELTQFLDVYNLSAPRTRTDGAYAIRKKSTGCD